MVSESRRRIEVAASGLLARHGYHGFGLKALSEAAELPYGSIYHHFPGGKEEIAVAAITGTGTLTGRMIRQAPTDVFATMATLFEFMVGKLADSQWTDGCPIGTPALDGGSDVEAVRSACVSAFDTMEQAFAGLLAELGLGGQEAAELATTVVAAYEGATILARIRQTDAPLRTVARSMERLIRSTFAAAGIVGDGSAPGSGSAPAPGSAGRVPEMPGEEGDSG
ncbi:TetR/AcrR family transcriptional regulator [Nocardia abscessus]|uniref:TetR/AcrR family transcriptional regulator n=1 Tax=Nocardia abscessus TaxID=120957 RepID=A0ABS0CAL4_9NOCA|nr:TetR/AcrR family transcriptional regulator [Nocardia abscessus]MBF6226563.1 TetR/AcrR family transcriptional regulator [Nocardia abscessus]